MSNIHNILLLAAACTLWVFTSIKYPNLDGVSVYQLMPTLPKQNKFENVAGRSTTNDTFITETMLIDYCIFPSVFTTLATQSNVETYLTGRGMGADSARLVNYIWGQLNFNAMKRSVTEYNLPYDGLVATGNYPEISSQYYHPVCRCMNKVFSTYEKKSKKNEFDLARQALDKCMATQYIIKRQTLVGSTDRDNKEIMNRKYISRHGTLFQLCAAFLVGSMYKMLDTQYPESKRLKTGFLILAIVITLILIWLANLLSVTSVNPVAGISWGSIVFSTGLAMGAAVELMWSFSAKEYDIHRITFMHPLAFYLVISALFIIASIENGVFTLSVLVTQVFQANALTMAYTGVLFVTHGKIWKTSTSSRTGFFLLILLAGLIHIYHLTPFYPVNTGKASFLWMLPTVFSVLTYSKILFIDHFMGEEDSDNAKENFGKRKTTHSEHLFEVGYILLVSAVIFHFIVCINDLGYGDPNATSTTYNAGKLTKRLNFAFGEVNVLAPTDQPFYSTLTNKNQNDFQTKYYVNP